MSVFIFGCSYYHARSPGEKIRYEEKVGREFALEASAQLNLFDEPEVLEVVRKVGHRIASHVPGSSIQYRFFVIRDPTMNAFSVPGGYIYIYLGLLAQMQNIDELAGVLGHEIAHVEANHFLRGQKKMEVSNIATLAAIILSAVLGGGEQAAAVGTLAQATQISTALHYSREFERESDIMSIRYVHAAGFDPKGILDLFETFYAKGRLNADELPPYFYTHPLPSERLNEVRTWIMVQHLSSPPPMPKIRNFDLARTTACFRFEESDHEIERQLKEIEKNPGQQDASFLLGYIFLKKGDLVPALEALEKAYNKDPSRPEHALYLARAYCLSGKIQKAAEIFQVASTLDPDNPLTEVFQGDLSHQQDDNKGALSHYQKALLLDPESPSAHKALGMTYGRLEETGLCYYHLGMAYKSAGRYLNALLYFKKALKFLDPKGIQGQEVLSEIKWLEG